VIFFLFFGFVCLIVCLQPNNNYSDRNTK